MPHFLQSLTVKNIQYGMPATSFSHVPVRFYLWSTLFCRETINSWRIKRPMRAAIPVVRDREKTLRHGNDFDDDSLTLITYTFPRDTPDSMDIRRSRKHPKRTDPELGRLPPSLRPISIGQNISSIYGTLTQ